LSFWKIVAAEENSTHFSSTLRHFGYTQFCTARIGSKLGTLITKSTGTDFSHNGPFSRPVLFNGGSIKQGNMKVQMY